MKPCTRPVFFLPALISAFFSALVAAPAHADVFDMPAGITSLQFSTVANPGNAADNTGYGAVSYSYDIGKFDVTAAQYCAFLNAVAVTDTYGLYNAKMNISVNADGCNIVRDGTTGAYTYSVDVAWANRPVNYVSWGDAARFCNWLQNGQKSGLQDNTTTEDGAYYLNGRNDRATLLSVTRKSGAMYCLPSENEWYKAAYYDPDKLGGPGYWDYPTRSDSLPSNALSTSGTNNANFNNGGYTIGSPYYRTVVGLFAGSPSAYGTFDQGGNVYQWNEAVVVDGSNSYRGSRGGAYNSTPAAYSNGLISSFRNYSLPDGDGSPATGFRLTSFYVQPSISWIGSAGDTKTAWGYLGNWSPYGSVPDGRGVKVRFGSQDAACSIVDMVSVGRTVGSIIFESTTSTLIQSTYGYSLTLDNGDKIATIDVSGKHYISAPVLLASDATISGGGTLLLANGISGKHKLTVTGKITSAFIDVDTLIIGSPSSSQAVPEPGTIPLLLAGGFCLAVFLLRRRNFTIASS